MLDRPAKRKPFAKPVPKASARRASLIHMSDDQPGITRKKTGPRFHYLSPKGVKLKEGKTMERVRALVIPPAWTDVWIAPDADAHIQATGRDIKGRKQYRYHERWSACRDEVKYSSLVDFAETLPKIRAQVESDLGRSGLPRERVIASIVWLLDNTMIRVGNSAYARDNKSFGLTTLRDRHVKIEGAKIRFAFKGKSGKEWDLQLVDRRIAKIVRGAQDLPGQHLFQYKDADGSRKSVRSQDVNAYLREASGAEFSSKHFRTWGGTISAASLFSQTPLPETKSATARAANAVIDKVAGRLGNTRTVCRNCYMHPKVMEHWLAGTLAEEMAAAARSFRKPMAGLDEEETLVLKWLTAN